MFRQNNRLVNAAPAAVIVTIGFAASQFAGSLSRSHMNERIGRYSREEIVACATQKLNNLPHIAEGHRLIAYPVSFLTAPQQSHDFWLVDELDETSNPAVSLLFDSETGRLCSLLWQGKGFTRSGSLQNSSQVEPATLAREWLGTHGIGGSSADWKLNKPPIREENRWLVSLKAQRLQADIGVDIASGWICSASVNRTPY